MEERINKILEKYNLSSAQFAENIGVQRSSISHIISGRNKPSYDFIVKIIEHFSDLNPEWLLTGKGNMLKIPLNTPISTQESDLFSQTVKTPSNISDIQSVTNNTLATENPLNSSKGPLNSVDDSPQNTKVTNVNKVKFVIFVYEDNSFEILNKK